jgi:TonB-dependent SusC/RagA subfamily outer membrane receptor
VLKDASSAAIYGARGANGVILVTTKRGKTDGDGVAVTYYGQLSVGTIARTMDVLDADQWLKAFQQGLENANAWYGTSYSTRLADHFTDTRLFTPNADGSVTPIYNTNWQDEATRTAVSHNHQINIQQSGANSSVGAFLNYTDQQGILLNSYMKRVNAKVAYDADATKWLSTSINLLVNQSWGNRTSDNPYGQGSLRTLIEELPWLPVKLDGEWTNTGTAKLPEKIFQKTDDAGEPVNVSFSPEGVTNPVHLLEEYQQMQYRTQIFGNAALTFHLAPGLDLKTQLGIDNHINNDRSYIPHGFIDYNATGQADQSNSNTLYWQEETYLNFNKEVNAHRINVMAGLSWQERTYNYFSATAKDFADDFFGYYKMGGGTERPSVGSDHDRWAMNSYFMRAAYTYNDKYSVTATGRYD